MPKVMPKVRKRVRRDPAKDRAALVGRLQFNAPTPMTAAELTRESKVPKVVVARRLVGVAGVEPGVTKGKPTWRWKP